MSWDIIFCLNQVETCVIGNNSLQQGGIALGKILGKMPDLKTLDISSCGLQKMDVENMTNVIGDSKLQARKAILSSS